MAILRSNESTLFQEKSMLRSLHLDRMRESFEYESMFFSAGMANVSNEPLSSTNYRLDFVE